MEIKFSAFQLSFLVVLWFCTSCNAQTKQAPTLVGGVCEGCEAIFEYGNKKLTAIDTLPKFSNNEPKLKITGTVLKKRWQNPSRKCNYLHLSHQQARCL